MTIEQLREKIAYRTQKMNWCISVGREDQAQWNRDQIARLEERIQTIEAQQDQEAINQRLIERNISRGQGNDVQPTVRNRLVSFAQLRAEIALANVRNRPRPERDTDEDFDYV